MNDEAIFTHALAIASASERAAYLDKVCAHDARRRQWLEGLRQAHQYPDSFLDAPIVNVEATQDVPLSDAPGTIIGPYKLLEQIGEGGFGVVYMAEQSDRIRRKVALNVLKPGMGIDLESNAFDTFLRLENAQGKMLAENDDIVPVIVTNSRLIFTPPTDGIYRLVASAFEQSGTGPCTLTIREFVK